MSEHLNRSQESSFLRHSLTIDFDMFTGFEMDSHEIHKMSFKELCELYPDQAWSIFHTNLKRLTKHATEITNSNTALSVKTDYEDPAFIFEAGGSLPCLDSYLERPVDITVLGPDNDVEEFIVLNPPSLVF